jgi:hypothetical protein
MVCGPKDAEAWGSLGKPAEACRSVRSRRTSCMHGPTTRKSKHHDISRHVHTTSKRINSDLIFAFFSRNHALIPSLVPRRHSYCRKCSSIHISNTLTLHRSLDAPGVAYIPADVATACGGRSKGYAKASKASTQSNNNNQIQLSSS